MIFILIKGFQRVSLIDYPGKLCSIVFVGSCNFRCPYCYNTELVESPEKLETIPEEEIINFMKKREGLLDGVCITGGEPTIYSDLPEFAKKIKDIGFLVKVDTNGSNPKILKELIEKKLVDYIAMDIKAPLEKYKEVAKKEVDLKKIQESINLIRNSGIEYEFRTTVLKKFFKRKDALAIGKWLKGSKNYCIQQFRPGKTLDKKIENEKPYAPEKLLRFAEILKPFFDSVEVRGI